MQIVEADQVDILAFTVPRDLQQIGEAEETRFSREFRRNLRKLDRLNRVDLDLSFVHTVTATGPYAWTTPNANAAGNLSAADSFAKTFGEDHAKSLHPVGWDAGPSMEAGFGTASLATNPHRDTVREGSPRCYVD